MEEWREVIGYEGVYSVSNTGKVRRDKACTNTFSGKILVQSQDGDGYCQVNLSRSNRVRTKKVHRLVMEAFQGPFPLGLTINHKDGSKFNNYFSNLEYCTRAANIEHAYQTGLIDSKGEKNPMAKLTWAIVRSIRQDYSQGKVKQRVLAEKYNITFQTIHLVVRNKSWRMNERRKT